NRHTSRIFDMRAESILSGKVKLWLLITTTFPSARGLLDWLTTIGNWADAIDSMSPTLGIKASTAPSHFETISRTMSCSPDLSSRFSVFGFQERRDCLSENRKPKTENSLFDLPDYSAGAG